MSPECLDGGVPEDDHSNSDIDFKGTPVMIPGWQDLRVETSGGCDADARDDRR